VDVMGLFADGEADGEDEWEADAKPVPSSTLRRGANRFLQLP